MLLSMHNGTSQNIINVAFYRSFEIMIGIVSGILVSYIVFPNNARQHINRIALPLTQALRRLLGCLLYTSPSPRD